MFLPKGSEVSGLDGWYDLTPPNVSTEGDYAVVGGWTDVAPGESRTVRFTFRLPKNVDLRTGTLPVGFWRQPGSNVTLKTEITLPDGYRWEGQPGAVVTGNVISFEEPVKSDILHQLTFRNR